MNPIGNNKSLQSLLVKVANVSTTPAPSIHSLFYDRIRISSLAFTEIQSTVDVQKIRKICFAYLEKICNGFTLDNLKLIKSEISNYQNKVDPSIITALTDKIDLLINCQVRGDKLANQEVLKRLFPDRFPPLINGPFVPTSGVMVTQETLGMMPNVTVITANYGVVIAEGTFPRDSILLLPSGERIDSIAYKKKHIEINELGEQSLKEIVCPQFSSIRCEDLAQLKEIKTKLEEFYTTPVEVKFISVPSIMNPPFVYLLDAIPLLESKKETNFSFAISLRHPDYHAEDDIFLRELSEEEVELEPSEKLIEHLQSPNPEVVRHALAALLFRLQQFIRVPLKEVSPQLQKRIKTLAAQVFHFGKNAYNAAVEKKKNEQLFAVKIIETRLRTALESHEIVDGQGFDQLAGEVILEKQVIEELGDVIFPNTVEWKYALELYKVGQMILDEKARKGWVTFLHEMFRIKNDRSIQALVGFIYWLKKCDSLELIMNTFFSLLVHEGKSRKQIMRSMLRSVRFYEQNEIKNAFKKQLLPQILKSRLGPLLKNLLQLSKADIDDVKLSYPWVDLQIFYPNEYLGSLINLRYHRQTGKVELQFSVLGGYRPSMWTNIATLAYVATIVLKDVSFIEGSTPFADGNKMTFSWNFNIHQEEGRTVEHISQILLKIIHLRQPDHGLSVFTLALECYRMVGKEMNLDDLLSALPDPIRDRFINFRSEEN